MDYNELIKDIADVLFPALGIFLTIHYYQRATGYLCISLNPGAAINPNGIGTHLAAIITISNQGRGQAFFGGLHALDKNGEYCYPPSSINEGSKLEPGQYTQGSISFTALSNVRKLWAVDGTGRKYRVNKFLLKRVVNFLELESLRWEELAKAQLPTGIAPNLRLHTAE
jgi:hypothetical protein